VPRSDLELIEEIRGGNARLYAILVDRHKDRAMTLAFRLVGDRAEAEELVQDGFVRAYRSLDRFRGEASFGSWFYRIVYNVCMTSLRRRHGKAVHVPLDDESIYDDALEESGELSLHEKLEDAESRRILQEEMDSLPHQYKAALTLFYVQELSYEEMTAVLELPLGTVKTNLSRGRTLLRKRISARMNEKVNAA
jgi:RNA polymerase sigma-70 factor (ECF subfamily)